LTSCETSNQKRGFTNGIKQFYIAVEREEWKLETAAKTCMSSMQKHSFLEWFQDQFLASFSKTTRTIATTINRLLWLVSQQLLGLSVYKLRILSMRTRLIHIALYIILIG
jgi:hypothetical protein